MTRDEALKLLEETYPGQLEITVNERFSDWQAAKKIYHTSDFDIYPEDYGMTKDNLQYRPFQNIFIVSLLHII